MKELTWVPGTLYKLGPKHNHYNSCGQLTFLCTKPMVAAYRKVDEGVVPAHVLINVDDGGLWNHNPKRDEYKEAL